MTKVSMNADADIFGKMMQQIAEAQTRVAKSGEYIRGCETEQLERELSDYTGSSHVRTCASATDALLAAFMSLGIGKGDEVICAAYGSADTLTTCALTGAAPVFTDIDRSSLCADPDKAEKLITPLTRAIVVTHMFGHPADMDRLVRMAHRHGLKVIEDATQALGTETYFDGKRRKAGTMGDIGFTSFAPGSNTPTLGDGGALFTDDEHTAEQISIATSQGKDKRQRFTSKGIRSNMGEMQAAALRIVLRHADELNSRRRWAALKYRSLLQGNEYAILPNDKDGHTFNRFGLRIKFSCRDDVSMHLRKNGVENTVDWPPLSHKQPIVLSYADSCFVEAEKAYAEMLCLPLRPNLTEADIEYTAQLLNAWKI